jgi:hypothetical protein
MASLSAPPGAAAQVQALIVSSFAGVSLRCEAPDADLQAAILTSASGEKLSGSKSIALHLAKAGSSAALVPADEVGAQQSAPS